MSKFDWNAPGVLEKFKHLCNEGYSFSQIGAMMGCSRNAAIGKAARLKLVRSAGVSNRNKSIARNKSLSRQRGERQQRKAAVLGPAVRFLVRDRVIEQPSEIVIPPEQMVTLPDLESHHCKYPVGDPSTAAFRFCGGPRLLGIAYCEDHARLCLRPNDAPIKGGAKGGFRLPQRQTQVGPGVGSGGDASPPAAKFEAETEDA